MSQPGVPAAPQTNVGAVLQESLDISKSSPLNYCFQGAKYCSTLFWESLRKSLTGKEKGQFALHEKGSLPFMKTAMEESSNLIATLNFTGFELKVFRCKKPHSLSSNIKRQFCPVLMIPSRGLPNVLPSEGFLTDTPEVYAGQTSVAIQADFQKETVVYNLPNTLLLTIQTLGTKA